MKASIGWIWLRVLRPALLILGLCLIALLVVRAPDVFNRFGADAADETAQSSAQRQSLLLLFGGILAAVTAFLAWKRHERERQALQIERDRHWTGRYTEAVSQLGESSTTINYGGLFALQRLAVETPELDDAQMVGNVISAYIRERASVAGGPTPEAEVDAAFQALAGVTEKHEIRCSFPQAHLEGLHLFNQSMTWADFTDAYLGDARFFRCNFSYSKFVRADLSGARLAGVQLKMVNFMGADLSDADLSRSTMQRCLLKETTLVGADLSGTDLDLTKGWTAEQFESAAKWDEKTIWPEGFTPSTPVKGN